MRYAVVQIRSDLPPGENLEWVKVADTRTQAVAMAIDRAVDIGLTDERYEDDERANLARLFETQDFVTDGDCYTIHVTEVA